MKQLQKPLNKTEALSLLGAYKGLKPYYIYSNSLSKEGLLGAYKGLKQPPDADLGEWVYDGLLGAYKGLKLGKVLGYDAGAGEFVRCL